MTNDDSKVAATFRLRRDVLELIRQMAKDDSRSMAGWIEQAALAAGRARTEAKPAAPVQVVDWLRAKTAAVVQQAPPPMPDDYDPDAERVVEPDPDYLASQRQPRK